MNPTSKTETAGPQTPDVPTSEATGTGADPAEDRAAQSAVTRVAGTPEAAEDQPQDTIPGEVTEAAHESAAQAGEQDNEQADEQAGEQDDEQDDDLDGEDLHDGAAAGRVSSGLGAASAAIVAVALGIVALTGTWTSQVAADRAKLVGNLHTTQTSTIKQQISDIYAHPWHVTAVINGGVALVALIVAVVVLALPRPAGAWVRPFAVAGVVLGAIGLLVAAGMYFDLFAAVPTAPAVPAAPATP